MTNTSNYCLQRAYWQGNNFFDLGQNFSNDLVVYLSGGLANAVSDMVLIVEYTKST